MEQNPTPNQPINEAPVVPEEELKMPEEEFGAPEAEEHSSKGLLFVLLGILVVLLLILGAVLVWGDQIMDMLGMNAETAEVMDPGMNDLQPEPVSKEPTPEEDLAEIEEELENTDFAEFDSELEAIEAEFESEATAE